MSSGESDYTTHCGQCGARSMQDCADGGQCEHISGPHPVAVTYEAPDPFPGNRKGYPVFTGFLMYFPDACAEIAACSLSSLDQHGLGATPGWDRSKSVGTGDELVRHLMQRGTRDADGIRHSAKAAWRAIESLQREIEAERVCDCPHDPGAHHAGATCPVCRKPCRARVTSTP